MRYLYTGYKGIPLKEIINNLGNKNYNIIECRCKWIDDNGQEQDNLFGYCAYIDGVLIPLDGDSYSLDDLYIEWEEVMDDEEKYTDNGGLVLTVWEYGGVQINGNNKIKPTFYGGTNLKTNLDNVHSQCEECLGSHYEGMCSKCDYVSNN